MQSTEHKSSNPPDETPGFPNGHAGILKIGGGETWVVGDEPVAVVDWFGASNYAKGG